MNPRDALKLVVDFLTASDSVNSIPKCHGIFLFGSSKTDQIPKSGAELFHMGLAEKIICTGKFSPRQTSGPFGFGSEAEWYHSILVKEHEDEEKETHNFVNFVCMVKVFDLSNLYACFDNSSVVRVIVNRNR